MTAAARRSRTTQAPVLLRYLAASLIALAVDYASFLTLLRLTVPAGPASILGYAAGVWIHWLVSSRAVFGGSVAPAGGARNRQQLLFIASALAGAALTGTVVSLGTIAGADPRLAKVAAIGISFIATWLLRRHVVFVEPSPAA